MSRFCLCGLFLPELSISISIEKQGNPESLRLSVQGGSNEGTHTILRQTFFGTPIAYIHIAERSFRKQTGAKAGAFLPPP
ncbi:hypothetical protein FE236_00930 [Mariprofundus erugo]|uniref:hypothetical protein n=1 Tax=Mariprofundus erugo TaxID=2528639 RepID=UPI0010FDF453|nr:hypothetical protein [Mariprofundus erugo]TLS78347.1 hypothetical protein FE236_00930 [Mariprofundus erugo]